MLCSFVALCYSLPFCIFHQKWGFFFIHVIFITFCWGPSKKTHRCLSLSTQIETRFELGTALELNRHTIYCIYTLHVAHRISSPYIAAKSTISSYEQNSYRNVKEKCNRCFIEYFDNFCKMCRHILLISNMDTHAEPTPCKIVLPTAIYWHCFVTALHELAKCRKKLQDTVICTLYTVRLLLFLLSHPNFSNKMHGIGEKRHWYLIGLQYLKTKADKTNK